MLISRQPTVPICSVDPAEARQSKHCVVSIGSRAQQHHFDVHKEPIRGKYGYGDGTKAWKLIQEKFCSVEGQTVVSLVSQLAKLRLGSEDDLDDYFIRSQVLMTRLSEAEEAITDTLFKDLVINGLPDSYGHSVVQENFQPAKTFPELITRLRSYDDSRKARCGERTGHGHIAMQAARKKKGVTSSGCYVCGQKGHTARDCTSKSDSGQSSARGRSSNEASGPGAKKQGCFKCGQPEDFARDCK